MRTLEPLGWKLWSVVRPDASEMPLGLDGEGGTECSWTPFLLRKRTWHGGSDAFLSSPLIVVGSNGYWLRVQVFPCDAKWPKWAAYARHGLIGLWVRRVRVGRLVHAVKPFQHSNRTSPKAVKAKPNDEAPDVLQPRPHRRWDWWQWKSNQG